MIEIASECNIDCASQKTTMKAQTLITLIGHRRCMYTFCWEGLFLAYSQFWDNHTFGVWGKLGENKNAEEV
jgi:hypothetical protein